MSTHERTGTDARTSTQERMLADLASAGAGDDPLGIAIPWEEKYQKR